MKKEQCSRKANKKIYRLSCETLEITEISEDLGLTSVGVYYKNPKKTLNFIGRIRTPLAWYSYEKNLLEDLLNMGRFI